MLMYVSIFCMNVDLSNLDDIERKLNESLKKNQHGFLQAFIVWTFDDNAIYILIIVIDSLLMDRFIQ